MPIPKQHHALPNESAEGFRTRLRASFLHHADQRVDLQNREDEDRIGGFTDDKRDRGGREQKIDERALELAQVDYWQAGASLLR
jgi:hypothetical protein